MRMLIGTAANFVSGYYIGRNSGLLGTLLGWAFLLGGGYLLIENWDSITVWMHSLNIVRGLDGYEDMSNGFIFHLFGSKWLYSYLVVTDFRYFISSLFRVNEYCCLYTCVINITKYVYKEER